MPEQNPVPVAKIPPRQRSAAFTIDQLLEKMTAAATDSPATGITKAA
jgi:hypothetical protein